MQMLRMMMAAVLVLGFSGFAHADFVGNKSSKMFFPADCSFAKMIKKDNVMNFKTAADAQAAGYKASSKCSEQAPAAGPAFVGNKSSKMFFPADCSYVKMIKDENKVNFATAAEATAAGYKVSSKCSDKK